MSHENITIVGRRKFQKVFTGQLTKVLAGHIEAVNVDVAKAEFFDGPLNPLLDMFFGPAHRIWITKKEKEV